MPLFNSPFWKIQGAGNDFIFVFEKDLPAPLTNEHIVRVCSRRTGAGADGLVLLKESSLNQYSWVFYNADGGEVNMCGNAARCAGWLLSHITNESKTQFQTNVGLVQSELLSDHLVRVFYEMRVPNEFQVIDSPCGGHFEQGFLLDTGVPHCVIPVKNLESVTSLPKSKLKPYIFSNEFGEGGANLTFYEEQQDSNKIRSVSFERGVNDFTLACGTGAIASVAVHLKRQSPSGAVSGAVDVHVPGGLLKVELKEKTLFLEGPVTAVYKGYL